MESAVTDLPQPVSPTVEHFSLEDLEGYPVQGPDHFAGREEWVSEMRMVSNGPVMFNPSIAGPGSPSDRRREIETHHHEHDGQPREGRHVGDVIR